MTDATPKNRRGGRRPGGGAKRKVEDAQKVLFYVEPETQGKMTYLAEMASVEVRSENAKLPTRDHDHLITRSELVRTAIERHFKRVDVDDEASLRAWVRQQRPYLGQPKPPSTAWSDPEDALPERLDTYLSHVMKKAVESYVEHTNEIVNEHNEGLAKADRDRSISSSELYRQAVHEFLETYRDEAVQVAHDLRPRLGRSKRTQPTAPDRARMQQSSSAWPVVADRTARSESEHDLDPGSTKAKTKKQQNMYLEISLVDAMRSIAVAKSTSVSHVASELIRAALRQYDRGQLEIPLEEPSTFSWPSDVTGPKIGHALFGGREAVIVLVERPTNRNASGGGSSSPAPTPTPTADTTGFVETARGSRAGVDVAGQAMASQARCDHELPVVTTNLVAEVTIENQEDLRHGQTVRLVIYLTEAIAEILGTTVENVRNWERNGRLPHSGFHMIGRTRTARSVRCYTYAQIRALMDVRHHLRCGTSGEDASAAFFSELRSRWDALPDGTLPQYRDRAATLRPNAETGDAVPTRAPLKGSPRRRIV